MCPSTDRDRQEHFVSGEAFLSDRGLRRYSAAARTLSYAGRNAWITGRADEARARMHRAAATIEDDAYARAVVQLMSSYLHVMLIEPEQAAVLSAQAIATAGPSTDFAKSAGGSGCLTAGRRRSWVIPTRGRA